MKNKIKLPGLLAFFMIIGLSFFSCNVDGGGGGGGSGTGGGGGIGGGIGGGGGTTYTHNGQTVTVQNTNGRLTITGFDNSYNGYRVMAYATVGNKQLGALKVPVPVLEVLEDFAQISNGSVTLNVWQLQEIAQYTHNYYAYSGNDKNVKFDIDIYGEGSYTDGYAGYAMVNFINGIGTGVFVKK